MVVATAFGDWSDNSCECSRLKAENLGKRSSRRACVQMIARRMGIAQVRKQPRQHLENLVSSAGTAA